MSEINVCPICNSVKFDFFKTCIDHSISEESFTIKKCEGCKLLITNPLPTGTEIARYYVSASYTSHAGKAATLIDRLYFITRNFTLKWKLRLINKRIQNKTYAGGKLLDVGCGTGEFLKTAKLGGWEVVGSEPSEEAIRHADPVIAQNIQSSLTGIRNKEHNFDAITLWHVLEHIETLNTTIQELKSMLTKSGTMYVAVPNHLSWDSQHYQNYWAGYDVPRHIWHFSTKNMRLLMSKHGLTVTEIIPMRLDAFYVSLLSEKYLRKKKLTISGMFKALVNGLSSNYHARKTMEYSSLIYVVKNENH